MKARKTFIIEQVLQGTPQQIKMDYLTHSWLIGAKRMPEEIFDVDHFVQLSERAEYCAVKKLKKTVKLKLRTPKRLYTLKVKPAMADEVVKKLSCEIREV